jgi:hypothetical protein
MRLARRDRPSLTGWRPVPFFKARTQEQPVFLEAIEKFLNENQPLRHVRKLWRPDIGAQINYVIPDPHGKQLVRRIPTDGKGERGEPYFDNTSYFVPPTPKTTEGIGVNGWNWVDQISEFGTFDLDSIVGHSEGLPQSELDEIAVRFREIPEVELIRSKGGHGYHARTYFEHPPVARTHKEHQLNCQRALRWLAERTGLDLTAKVDCCGVIAWIWHRNTAPNGFELIKPAERKLSELPASAPTNELPDEPREKVEFSSRQQQIVKAIQKRGFCEIDPATNRVTCHTATLAKLQAMRSVHVRGKFETIATGREPGDHNCFMFPQSEDEGGGWTVYRFNDAKEHPSWQPSVNGHSCALFDSKQKKSKAKSVANVLVNLGTQDDLFHGPDGRAYATLKYGDRVETWAVGEDSYKSVLRRRYAATGEVVEDKHLKNAVAELSAIARLDRPQHDVFVRVAGHGGKIYLDLCNQQRQAVEISESGPRVIDNPPVRFRRTPAMLPLPTPQPGKIDLLRPFVNVTDDDWPLFVGALIMAFRPTGPYPPLVLIGGPGAAKSTLSRVFQRCIDPNGGDVRAQPKNIDDLCIAANNSWLVTFDNISSLGQPMSDAFCRLSTGGGFGKRKLFSDDGETVFKSQRPLILNSVKDIVTAPDLLDRSIVLDLYDLERVKDEDEFWAEFNKVQPAILGALLDAVACAIRNLPTTRIEDSPRMADFARWVTAAEPALGFERGTILAAYRSNLAEVSGQTLDTEIGRAIIALADAGGFKGEPSKLPTALNTRWPLAELQSELRMLTPSLKRAGIAVKRGKSNGKRVLEIGKVL